jgi:hypothetical protein
MKNILLFLFLFSAWNVSAQEKEDTTVALSLQDMFFAENYILDKPDSSFTALPEGGGYTNKEGKATVKFVMTFPFGIEKGKREVDSMKNSMEQIILDKKYHYSATNELESIIAIIEVVPPKDSGYENYIMIQCYKKQDKATLAAVGFYLKSLDKEGFREKIVRSCLSIRKL